MRIAMSGCANSGKSTIIKSFLQRWPMYLTPKKTYRDIIQESGLEHSSKTSQELQLTILDFMMLEHDKYLPGEKAVFDRCPLDNLVYTLQANSRDLISDEVTAATISLVRESMKNLDIVFWLPYDPDIRIVDDSLRDTDISFIKETNQIFSDLYDQYCDNLESDIFFPKEDCPAFIKLEGKSIDDRIGFISEFIDYKGDLIETENSILDPANVDLMEQMLDEQVKQGVNEEQLKRVLKNIITQ